MDSPKSKKLAIVIPTYRMHSQSFKNALAGISEEAALQRIDNNTNHVVWMVGNFISCRYWVGNMLCVDEKDPHDELFREGKALDESLQYPSLEALKQVFTTISPLVYKKLLVATDEQLEQGNSFGMNIPFVEENVLNMIGMCVGREDYLLGQIGLMRKLLGLKGMSYDMDADMNY